MFFHPILWLIYSDTVLAANLPRRSQSIGSLAAGSRPSSTLLSPANVPAASRNDSSGNLLKIACDAARYGKDLKVNSCRNIFHFLTKDENQFTFGDRDSGLPFDVPLPLRTFSNDGLCFVQPVLTSGATLGHASSTQIGQAAYTMLQTCVVERGMGGMASNIGGDNKINVAIAKYNPRVKCDPTSTPGPAWKSCVSIFANMRATKRARVFGVAGEPDVEERLPLILEAPKGTCQVYIDIDGPATVATWYELWEAVTATAMMCTRQKGKGGKAKGLGLRGTISLEVSEQKDEPGAKGGNASAASPADAGAVLQYFASGSPQAGSTGFAPGVPLELVAGALRDDGAVVTRPGDSGTNRSAMAGA